MTTVGPQPDIVRDAREAPQRALIAKAKQEAADAPLIARLSTPDSRADVWRDLRPMRLVGLRTEALAMAYAAGERDVAVCLWRECARVAKADAAVAEMVAAMVVEGIRREGDQ